MPLSLSSYKNSKELMTLLETNNMMKLWLLMMTDLIKVCSVAEKFKKENIQETWDGMPHNMAQETDRD